jgi:hypothetical protein
VKSGLAADQHVRYIWYPLYLVADDTTTHSDFCFLHAKNYLTPAVPVTRCSGQCNVQYFWLSVDRSGFITDGLLPLPKFQAWRQFLSARWLSLDKPDVSAACAFEDRRRGHAYAVSGNERCSLTNGPLGLRSLRGWFRTLCRDTRQSRLIFIVR